MEPRGARRRGPKARTGGRTYYDRISYHKTARLPMRVLLPPPILGGFEYWVKSLMKNPNGAQQRLRPKKLSRFCSSVKNPLFCLTNGGRGAAIVITSEIALCIFSSPLPVFLRLGALRRFCLPVKVSKTFSGLSKREHLQSYPKCDSFNQSGPPAKPWGSCCAKARQCV